MKRPLILALKIIVGCCFLFGLVLLCYVVFVVVPRIKSKEEAYHATAMKEFRSFIEQVSPEAQFESDTCGLHALRIVYKGYGLNPDSENLRMRLGVDVASNPIDPDSSGTLQPDVLRVLIQDKFKYKLIDFDAESPEQILTDHLESGNMALILIARRENRSMHWVVASRVKEGKIEILDSLFEDPYVESPSSFFEDCVLSCVMVEEAIEEYTEDATRFAMFDGAFELFGTVRRYAKITDENDFSNP